MAKDNRAQLFMERPLDAKEEEFLRGKIPKAILAKLSLNYLAGKEEIAQLVQTRSNAQYQFVGKRLLKDNSFLLLGLFGIVNYVVFPYLLNTPVLTIDNVGGVVLSFALAFLHFILRGRELIQEWTEAQLIVNAMTAIHESRRADYAFSEVERVTDKMAVHVNLLQDSLSEVNRMIESVEEDSSSIQRLKQYARINLTFTPPAPMSDSDKEALSEPAVKLSTKLV